MVRDGASAPPHHEGSRRIARCGETGVPNRMASNPTAAPILFDRALLRVRQNRARRGEPATFLLDRVAEDIEERLHAVLREFADAADIWTPGEILRKPLRDRFKSVTQSVWMRPGKNSSAAAGIARSGGFRAGLSVRQRSARRARADPPRVAARWAVAGGDARRRHADRVAAVLSRRPKPNARAACRPGLRRLPICAMSARCCNARALRCRSPTSIAWWCATTARLR